MGLFKIYILKRRNQIRNACICCGYGAKNLVRKPRSWATPSFYRRRNWLRRSLLPWGHRASQQQNRDQKPCYPSSSLRTFPTNPHCLPLVLSTPAWAPGPQEEGWLWPGGKEDRKDENSDSPQEGKDKEATDGSLPNRPWNSRISSPSSQHTSLNVSTARVATAGAAAFMALGTGLVPVTQLLARKGVSRTFATRFCHRIRAWGPEVFGPSVSGYFHCDS